MKPHCFMVCIIQIMLFLVTKDDHAQILVDIPLFFSNDHYSEKRPRLLMLYHILFIFIGVQS